MGDLDKTDALDALVAGDWLRTRRRLPAPFTWDARYLSLRFLTRYRFPDPTENARKLCQIAQDSYRLPQALQAPIQLVLALSLALSRT